MSNGKIFFLFYFVSLLSAQNKKKLFEGWDCDAFGCCSAIIHYAIFYLTLMIYILNIVLRKRNDLIKIVSLCKPLSSSLIEAHFTFFEWCKIKKKKIAEVYFFFAKVH